MGGFLQQLADGRARALDHPAIACGPGFRKRNLQLVIHFCLDFMAVDTLYVSHGCSIEFVEPAYLFRSRRKTVCPKDRLSPARRKGFSPKLVAVVPCSCA